MGNIPTTKRILNDDLDGGPVFALSLGPKTPAEDTLAKRYAVTVHFSFGASAGPSAVIGDSKTRMLQGHPALSMAQRQALREIAAVLHQFELDNASSEKQP